MRASNGSRITATAIYAAEGKPRQGAEDAAEMWDVPREVAMDSISYNGALAEIRKRPDKASNEQASAAI